MDEVVLRASLEGAPEQLNTRVGIEFTQMSPGRVVATMPVAGNRQPYGLLHGGASCVLAEALGSVAAAMHAGAGRSAVGVALTATHHRSATAGLVTGVCTPLHQGRSMASYLIEVTDDGGERICTATLMCALRDRPPAR